MLITFNALNQHYSFFLNMTDTAITNFPYDIFHIGLCILSSSRILLCLETSHLLDLASKAKFCILQAGSVQLVQHFIRMHFRHYYPQATGLSYDSAIYLQNSRIIRNSQTGCM